jgi:hypothetical protein
MENPYFEKSLKVVKEDEQEITLSLKAIMEKTTPISEKIKEPEVENLNDNTAASISETTLIDSTVNSNSQIDNSEMSIVKDESSVIEKDKEEMLENEENNKEMEVETLWKCWKC